MSVHNELKSIRRKQRLEGKTYVVRRVNRDGSISRSRPHDLNYCATFAEASARETYLEEMNPGSRFMVCPNN